MYDFRKLKDQKIKKGYLIDGRKLSFYYTTGCECIGNASHSRFVYAREVHMNVCPPIPSIEERYTWEIIKLEDITIYVLTEYVDYTPSFNSKHRR